MEEKNVTELAILAFAESIKIHPEATLNFFEQYCQYPVDIEGVSWRIAEVTERYNFEDSLRVGVEAVCHIILYLPGAPVEEVRLLRSLPFKVHGGRQRNEGGNVYREDDTNVRVSFSLKSLESVGRRYEVREFVFDPSTRELVGKVEIGLHYNAWHVDFHGSSWCFSGSETVPLRLAIEPGEGAELREKQREAELIPRYTFSHYTQSQQHIIWSDS